MATARFDSKGKSKRTAIAALYAIAGAIVAAGLGFAAYCIAFHVNYTVFSMEIPGYVFAAFVVFLGVRYLGAVRKLSRSLPGGQQFSWSNFRGSKANKNGGLRI